MNPLFNMLGGGALPPVIQQFNNFRKNFTGDPRQQVQQLLNSGKVTQEQYNAAVQKANALKQMLGM